MLPRHLVPLAMGLIAFAVAQAASKSPREDMASFGVACAGGRIAIAATDEGDGPPRSVRGRSACTLERFSDRAAAERYASETFGGRGRPCSCD